MPDMRFLCFGAGAIGTYIGGSLALNGNEVVFLDRPDVAAELNQRGMHLRLLDGEHTLEKPGVVSSIESALAAGPFDAAIFAVKSFDTVPLLNSFQPFLEQLPPFLSLQNGVENEEKIAAFLGKERVIAATVTTAIGRRDIGDIVVERLRGTGIAGNHSLSPRLERAFSTAGLKPSLFSNANAMKWSKMLTNLVANASSAILDMTPGRIFQHPGLFRIEVLQLRETLNVMAGQHIPVVNLPGTPVRLLAFGVRNLPLPILQPLLKRAAGSGRGGKMPSFHIDLYSGRSKSEVDYLNGAVVRMGEKLGISTPVNRILTETLLGLTEGRIPKNEFAHQPEKFLTLFNI